MNKWKWTAAALMIALLLAMNLIVFDKKETTAIEAPRLETKSSIERDFIKEWKVTGVAQSKNTFNIYKDPSLGSIKEILVTRGETVTSGQTLITYQDSEIEKEIRELKRDKEAADVRADHYSSEKSDWESELSNFDDEKDSADAKVRLQEQLAQAELETDLAEKESALLYDEIMELEKKLDELSVKSPADGIVSERNGIQEDEPILTITGQGNFEMRAAIKGAIAGIVKTGDSVKVQIPNSKKKLNGTVQTVLPSDKEQIFTMTVLVEDEFAWTEGQTATIIIPETLAEKAVSVPEKAVIKDDGKQYVYIIVKGKLYKVKVIAGVNQRGVVEIKKGLKKGQAVVMNPSPVFVSGQPAIKK